MNFAANIKLIRKKTGLTQEELANKLNVSVPTINRWENDKAKPSQLARKNLIEFCKNNSIDFENL